MKEVEDKDKDKKFHQRNRGLILLAALGGVYLPSVKRIIPYGWVQYVLKGYGTALVSSLMFCAIMAGYHMIFLADNLILRIMAANNVFNDFVCCGRAFLFNYNRDKAQALYDKWDEYFVGDGHGPVRKKHLDDITKPNRKYIIGSAAFIQFMLVSWSSEQLGHENCEFSVPVGLPFNNRNPEYLIWATMIFITFSLFGPMLLSVDALIMDPLTLIAAEFVRLRHSLADILNTSKITDDGTLVRCKDGMERPYLNEEEMKADFAEVDFKVKSWIAEHQKVLDFHMAAVEIIHWPLAIQLFCTTMTVCLISFIVAMNLLSPFDTLIALLFFVPNYVLFFITSTYGNKVEEYAAEVLKSGFATAWSVYPLPTQKKIHIIAMRANYKVGLNIGHMYPLGCNTYFTILQTAYSFYSFLRMVTEK